MHRLGRGAVAVGFCLLPMALSGCRTTGLVFVQDDAIVMTAPATSATVDQPVTVSWRVKAASPKYAVFVDQMPMAVGEALGTRLDHSLAFETTQTSVQLEQLRPAAGATQEERNHHQVTVVMLDANGVRQGEEAASVEFSVRS